MTTPDDRPPVDPGVLETLRALSPPGGPDVLTELIDLFLDDTPVRLAALGRALAGGDTQAVRREAHTLKGSARNLGATSLADLCGEFERRAGAGALPAAGVAELEREFARVAAALTAERWP